MATGLGNFPKDTLDTATGMWANMLFWAFLLTTVVYVTVGVACAVSMRLIKKGVSVGIPLFFLVYAALRVICGDAIACAFVAGIYMTLGWSMSSAAALGWGVGLSAISLTLTTLTSLVPIYAVL
jgi:hypothetical protein